MSPFFTRRYHVKVTKPALVIGDTHIPFVHRNYLEFCKETQKKFKCEQVVHIGDLVDNHSISYHEHDPNGWSPRDEMIEADDILSKWFRAFPRLFLCRGNHDALVDRKGRTSGLPQRAFKPYRDIWNLPKEWQDGFEWEINGVLFTHGTGFGGKYPHINAAITHRQSTVIGHLHSVAGIEYTASSKDIIYGMSTGCGVDRKAYAFGYGKDCPRKQIVGCGIIYNNKEAQFIPMEMT